MMVVLSRHYSAQSFQCQWFDGSARLVTERRLVELEEVMVGIKDRNEWFDRLLGTQRKPVREKRGT